MKKLFVALLVLIVLATAGAGGGWFWLSQYYEQRGPLKEEVILIIEPGTRFRDIAKQLADAQVIRYPLAFEVKVRLEKAADDFRAGEYAFAPAMTPRAVAAHIVSGAVVQHRITLAEGLTTAEMLAIVAADPVLTGEIPSGIPEGALLPETYHFPRGTERTQIVQQMQKAMTGVLGALWAQRAGGLPLADKQEALTLASIVEKETGIPEERGRVAAVFTNRLKRGMKLQADPTVIYGITQGAGKLDRSLSRKDLAETTPYNTYVIEGLPPGPIAAPGRASLAAVLNPPQDDALYFVATGTGGHHFAATLTEHNRNVMKLRRFEKSAK